MNKPCKHHPHNDLIYNFASGSKDEALNLALATHLHYCSECADFFKSAEHLFGNFFSDMAIRQSDSDNIDASFDKIWSSVRNEVIDVDTIKSDIQLSPLDDYIKRNQHLIKVKKTFPSITETILPLSNKETKVSIMEIDAGTIIPNHTHQGVEITQILSGGFYDQTGSYHQGDLTIKDNKDNHTPTIFDDAPCRCLVVRYGGLEFTGAMGLIYNPIFRLLD